MGDPVQKDAVKKIDRRTKRTTEALRRAFVETLSEKPLNKVTVSEVTRRADIDRKTFYLHYGSIEDLIDDILKEEVERMSRLLSEVTVDAAGRVDVRGLFKALASELAPSIDERAAIIEHVDTETIISRIEPLLVDAVVEEDILGLAGHLGPYLDSFATFYCAGVLAVFRKWVETDSELPMEELAAMSGIAVSGAINALILESGKFTGERASA